MAPLETLKDKLDQTPHSDYIRALYAEGRTLTSLIEQYGSKVRTALRDIPHWNNCQVKDCPSRVRKGEICYYHKSRRARGLSDWPQKIGGDHGMPRRYRAGCRCDLCKKAMHEINQRAKERRNNKGMPDGVAHGNLTTYTTWKCRCDVCREYHRNYQRITLAKRKGIDPATLPPAPPLQPFRPFGTKRDYCFQGHPYTPETTGVTNEGYQLCLICHNQRLQEKTFEALKNR